jgi:short-subunit dehydrogenase
LEELQKEMDIKIVPLAYDLSKEDSVKEIEKKLQKEKPVVDILINAAGYGKFEKTTKVSFEDNLGMVKLNCEGLTSMCLITIPFMKKGSKIINFASVAAFQPVPYINIYAASKAYVLSFSRSLNRELKSEGIQVMAICPFWTKTKFFDRAVTKNTIVKKYVAMYESMDNVQRAWRDLKKGKDVSQYGFKARAQVKLCKILPHSIVMSTWQRQQKLK